MKAFVTEIIKTALGVFIGAGALVIAVNIYDSYRIHRHPQFGSIQFDGSVSLLEQPVEDIAIVSF